MMINDENADPQQLLGRQKRDQTQKSFMNNATTKSASPFRKKDVSRNRQRNKSTRVTASKVFGSLLEADCDTSLSLTYSPSPVAASIQREKKSDCIASPRAFSFEMEEDTNESENSKQNSKKENLEKTRKALADISTTFKNCSLEAEEKSHKAKDFSADTKKSETKIKNKDATPETCPEKQSNNKDTEDNSSDVGRSPRQIFPDEQLLPEQANEEMQLNEAADEEQTTENEATVPKAASPFGDLDNSGVEVESPRKNPFHEQIHDGTRSNLGSVNESLNAVRRAKIDAERAKQVSTANLRAERRLEKEEAEAFQEEVNKTKRELQQLKDKLATKYRKAKVGREQALRQARRQKIMKESLFKSSVYRAHQKDLMEDAKRRRRESVATRAKMRAVNRAGTERMKLARIEEEQALFEERHLSSVAWREAADVAAEQRRKSLAFRNKEGRRQREDAENQRMQLLSEDHESFELKWAGEKDAEDYQKQLAEERRESFAFRNAEGKRQRELKHQQHTLQVADRQESNELKWEGECDAQEYENFLSQERRQSFAGRNKQAKQQREEQEQRRMEEINEEHASYELKWDAERDAKNYCKQMAQERRESFEFRNREGQRIRDLGNEQRVKDLTKSHESYELEWAGYRDARAYQERLAEERRQSFAFRNQEGRRRREEMEQRRGEQLSASHDDFELKWAAENDANEYKKKVEDEVRNNFVFGNAEAKLNRAQAEQVKTEEESAKHDSYELKWAGERDAETYRRKLEEEKRNSFAFRNEEGRKHREWAAQEKSDKLAKEHDSYELKWDGERDAEAYERQMAEQRRESFAFRNQEGRKHRELAEHIEQEEYRDRHESFELKWAGERDAAEYKSQLDQERRDSFAFRNQEGKKQREDQEHRRMEEQAAEHESYELKWAGERDAKAYEEQVEEERRQSFAARNAEGVRQRAVLEELRGIAKEKEHESFVLEWAAQNDVKEYLSECASRDRTSLQFRRKEARLQRLKEEEERQANIQNEHESYELEAEARRDVKEYVQQCKKRDRLSLVSRAKEKRRHAEWERRQAQMQREERSRETRDRAMDQRYMKLAEEKERAQRAIDALRHANRSFAMNPFASLLD